MAPTVYLEQLEYDCRLMNAASDIGRESVLNLQKLLTRSDIHHDPQALILSPENVIKISEEIVEGDNHLDGAVRGALKGLELIRMSTEEGKLFLDEIEKPWLEILRTELENIDSSEEQFTNEVISNLDKNKLLLVEYGL
jgi:methanol--5-hydroxybenzimidazolylcobamide Co-methyltransferase